MIFNMFNTVVNLDLKALYIDPTAITTSLVSASGIIIALGASAGVLLGRLATASARLNVFVTKMTRGFVTAFCVVDHAGKTFEPDITLKKKL